MNAQQLREKTVEELKVELTELLKEQFNLRMQKGLGDPPKPHLYKRVRHDIARVQTILRQKESQS